MDSSEILRVIKDNRRDIAWKYLDYLVEERGSVLPEHHTELAVLQIAYLAAMMPKPDTE